MEIKSIQQDKKTESVSETANHIEKVEQPRKESDTKQIDKATDNKISFGMNIGQDHIDDIDDIQSPPNSPGLVYPAVMSNTNAKIDFFALEPSDKPAEPEISSLTEKKEIDDSKENITKGVDNISSISSVTSTSIPNINITASSDSYFSRTRRTPFEKKSRRASDISDRSDFYGSVGSVGSFDGSFDTESDTDITGSPSVKYMRRKTNRMYDLNNGNGNNSNNTDVNLRRGSDTENEKTPSRLNSSGSIKQFDDGIVYRTISNISESDTGYDTPRSNRSTYTRRKSKDYTKDKESINTAQIFKNLLILEESLKQQYVEQQTLRYKYSAFLIVLLAIFSFSTYTSITRSIYSTDVLVTNIDDQKIDEHHYYNEDIKIHKLEEGYNRDGDKLYAINLPDFPTLPNWSEDQATSVTAEALGDKNKYDYSDSIHNDELQLNDKDASEYGYSLLNIINRVIAIITGMTLVLFYLSGEYTRTISRPRKFLTNANKGIRQLNVRLVKMKVPIETRLKAILGILGVNSHSVRLVLNPRVFTTGVREQWELYRGQFWTLRETVEKTG